jgi:hypothetical protein
MVTPLQRIRNHRQELSYPRQWYYTVKVLNCPELPKKWLQDDYIIKPNVFNSSIFSVHYPICNYSNINELHLYYLLSV